jgi:hypothetical protein
LCYISESGNCAIYLKNEQSIAMDPLPRWERYFSAHSSNLQLGT